MKTKINPTRAVFGCLCFVALVAANKPIKNEKLKYSPYQIMVWEIKANEGYRSWWYKDGMVRGKQAYSIGFGWNDQGCRRRNEIKEFTKDGKVTFNEATTITIKELDKYGRLHKDDLKNNALRMYSYARGLTKNGSSLGKCCNASWGCGNPDKNIRKGHNRRRRFELACWRHDYATINQMTEENLQKLIAMGRN